MSPIMYSGHCSQSVTVFHSSFALTPVLLFMSPLDGSSRKTRLTRMYSSCSLNHPFLPRNQLAVWVAPAGIRTNENTPMTNVNVPSIRNLIWSA